MERIGVWIPCAALEAGESVQVYGSDAAGTIDLAAGEPGGRGGPRPGRDNEAPRAGRGGGVEHLGQRYAAPAMQLVHTRELPTGLYRFGLRAFDRETAVGAADPAQAFTIFLNTAPPTPRAVRVRAELVGGRLAFDYGTPA